MAAGQRARVAVLSLDLRGRTTLEEGLHGDRPGARRSEPAGSKGLKAGSLGLLGSIVMGIASTAPAYSLAASLGYVVITENGGGIVGVKAPLIMVVAFVPMYFIAVAYSELNKAEPDCGTTFTWAARAFGTRTGWMGGWGIIAADVIVMANLAQIAGSYSFSLVGVDDLAGEHVLEHGRRHRLDRGHDLHLLPRHRGLGPAAVRPARRRGGHPDRRSRCSRWSRCTPATRRPATSSRRLSWLSPSGLQPDRRS